MKRTVLLAAIAAFAVTSAAGAATKPPKVKRAWIQRISLTSGALAGTTLRLSFTLDGTRFVRGGLAVLDDPAGLGIPGFDLTLGGTKFGPGEADATFLLTQGERITDYSFGGALDGFATIRAGGADFLLDSSGFLYSTPGATTLGSGTVDYFAEVPAPGAAMLFGLGAAGLLARRRRPARA